MSQPSFLHALLQNRTRDRDQQEPLALLSTHQLPQVSSSVLAPHSPDQYPGKGFTPIPTSPCTPDCWSPGCATFTAENTALRVRRSLSLKVVTPLCKRSLRLSSFSPLLWHVTRHIVWFQLDPLSSVEV